MSHLAISINTISFVAKTKNFSATIKQEEQKSQQHAFSLTDLAKFIEKTEVLPSVFIKSSLIINKHSFVEPIFYLEAKSDDKVFFKKIYKLTTIDTQNRTLKKISLKLSEDNYCISPHHNNKNNDSKCTLFLSASSLYYDQNSPYVFIPNYGFLYKKRLKLFVDLNAYSKTTILKGEQIPEFCEKKSQNYHQQSQFGHLLDGRTNKFIRIYLYLKFSYIHSQTIGFM